MRLKQIKLAGFKSFVDVTKIPFEQQLSAIIGPNGCGKSNIIDAVRWVLGESSAKNLRGDSMTDVIFNGSSVRRPVSVAGVELVFDNSLGRLAGQYASYQEISVKRQVSRDGDSFYFLNGQKCRRKDITDLFMGTGLGPRSYAIIEQGTISRLIESRPQDLRVFIEEAAGISRYKERRKETENRIRHTRDNLERLNDIRLELGSQLDKLAEQAKSALAYREFKQQERQLQAQLLVVRYQELALNTEKIDKEIQLLELELAEINAAAQAASLSLLQWQTQLAELNEQEQQQVEHFYQSRTDIAKCEQALHHWQTQHSQWQQQKQALTTQLAQTAQDNVQGENELQRLEADHVQQHTVWEASQYALEILDEQINQLEESSDALNENLSRCQETLANAKMAHAVENAKREHTQKNLLHAEHKLTELANELETLQAIDNSDARLQLSQALSDNAKALSQQTLLSAEHEHSMQAQEQALNDKLAHHQQLTTTLTSAKARHQVIEEWLAGEQESDGSQLLWQHIKVTPGWELAVELALQPVLQANVLQGESKAGFIHSAEYESNHQAFSAAVNLTPWTERLIWVEDLAYAKAHLNELKPQQCFVSRDGYLLGHGFLLQAQSQKQSNLLLTQELNQLSSQISRLASEVELSEQQVLDARNNLAEVKLLALECQRQGHALALKKQALSSEMAKLLHQDDAKETNLAKIASSQAQLEQQREDSQVQLLALMTLLDSQDDELQGLSKKQQELNQEWLSVSAQLRQAKAQRIEQDNIKRQHEHARQTLSTQVALQQQTLQQIALKRQELNHSLAQLEQASRQQQSSQEQDQQALLEQNLATLLQTQAQQQGLLNDTRAKQAQVQIELDNVLLTQKQQLGIIEGLTQKIGALKLRREGFKGQADGQQQLLDEHKVDVSAVARQLKPDVKTQQLSNELDKLRAEILKLGAINLAAIEEYEVQEQRKAYLDAQDEDLNKGLMILEDAIRKIDKETRSRFKATFEAVNKDLGLLFPKVFGGGQAYLALTEDDLLETGVTIMAQPPGKKNSSIHLLSGGEKALTALSLVFAIFRLNPAPFCMLDEVDAPLDDANVERFCRLLQEMSQSVQFIYISHNKITMEMADQLIGVTMHEPGVSRIVAVDIEQAVAMADAL
ncbi:Chromosome segregation protein SMC [Shewanella denitrificans OS217]|uniref:Chromosome partition protein Smc n=1 Tax=Shewanella denitrificans (strain OS217 / ATCC BAA-1090 / DSM 15013) TaxID=318161 RepID=Q12L80_SHEDO|nr:AAA family ATPase [Shewanella denitrificans]ABE55796.1 Chromosome segregation protein SMC [Shewanella denitrificans OS217]